MPDVLVASDEAWVREEVASVLSTLADTTVREVSSGAAVAPAVQEAPPDLVVADLQIGNMGGFAVCLELHLEESAGRLPHVPVLLLLDRRADVFLGRRADVEGWLIKPLDPIRLRKAVTALLEGGTYHDESYRPVSVASHYQR
ncbi:MAG: response regulator [Actinomycetota bacterium]|nr:response regulator [Actinomycetota bacterium]